MGNQTAKYTTGHILRIFNMKMDKCRDWHNRGYIEPTVPSLGQGYKARYTIEDLYGIALFIKLTEKGYKRELAAEIVKSTRTKGVGPFSAAEFVLYQTVRKDGELEVKPTYLSGGDYAIHISPKKLSVKLVDEAKYKKTDESEQTLPDEGNEIWEDMFLINLIRLRQVVDTALGQMA